MLCGNGIEVAGVVNNIADIDATTVGVPATVLTLSLWVDNCMGMDGATGSWIFLEGSKGGLV